MMSPGKGLAGDMSHEIPKSPIPSPTHSPIRSPGSPKKEAQKSPKKGKGKGKGKVTIEETTEKKHYTDDFENGNNTQENVSSIEEDKMRESKSDTINMDAVTKIISSVSEQMLPCDS